MTLAVPTAWALVRVASAMLADEDISTFHGARLGMTPSDVREHLDLDGDLRAISLPDGSYALALAPSEDPGRSVGAVRFEFHLGLLVAIRAELAKDSSSAQDDPLVVTSGAVRQIAQRADRAELTLLSRSCPTHADEVRSLLEGSPATSP